MIKATFVTHPILLFIKTLQTNREYIAAYAETHAAENDTFIGFVRNANFADIDEWVADINADIEPAIDCTQCGACCKTLMINVTQHEAEHTASYLSITLEDFKRKYIEESQQGQLIMSQMPCHFLEGSRCGIYEQRFTECRNFPHLHRSNFKDRMFGTMIYYAICPIIFNVVETLKIKTKFKEE
ncbi:MAG: YkgJ family cysteine cluster protein [Ferruginibacter sp.]